jgi:hypothetical protein
MEPPPEYKINKPWRCECGELLGMVAVRDGRHTLEPTGMPGAWICGDAWIPCSECGTGRRWRDDTRAPAFIERNRERWGRVRRMCEEAERDIDALKTLA